MRHGWCLRTHMSSVSGISLYPVNLPPNFLEEDFWIVQMTPLLRYGRFSENWNGGRKLHRGERS